MGGGDDPLATSLPNRYRSQNKQRNGSRMYNAAIWEAHLGMQWNTWWYTNTLNFKKATCNNKLFGKNLPSTESRLVVLET